MNNNNIFQEYINFINGISKLKLTKKQYKILHFLIKNSRIEDDTISITLNDIAEQLNISRITVIRTFKKLKEKGILIKLRNGYYQINYPKISTIKRE